ncbi:MAG TPA: Crp/Fnr family transcriptional regulator [Cyclobacteriaceae bacterium]|nr:Crp/Fnr family transcriptional regulator [Cyclobacteriaceae bacterium]
MFSKALTTAIQHMTDLFDAEEALFKAVMSSRRLKKGEIVLQEGTVCRAVYFVEEGYLRTYYNKEDGSIVNLNFTFEGEFTGDLKSAISREPSTLSIEAGEDSLLWIFDLNKLSPEMKSHPSVSRFIRRTALQMLLASEARGNLLKMYTPAERYHYLERNTPHVLQRVSLSHLASFLGVSRETLSRIRAKKV